jgi:AcrR family transcriptional regulator
VRDILERANVGRSTFYMHFRDKDELLVSGLQERLRLAYRQSDASGRAAKETLGFSLPMFEHIHEHRHRGEAVGGPGAWSVVHGHLRKEIAEMIAAEVKAMNRRRPKTAVHLPLDLLVQHMASTFILVLTWWAEGRSTLTPREANALFRALIPWG